MRLSIQGYVRNQRNLFTEGAVALEENSHELNHDAYEKIEHSLEEAIGTTLVFYDLIMAILKGDISKEEAIVFLALDAEKLEKHKPSNDLITFS